MASSAHSCNQPEKAEEYLQRGLALSEEAGDREGVSAMLHTLGQLAEAQERYADVRQYREESMAVSEELQDVPGMITSLGELVDVAIAESDHPAADGGGAAQCRSGTVRAGRDRAGVGL